MSASRKRATGEIAGVLGTAAVFVVLNDVLQVNRFFLIAGLCLAWIAYLVLRLRESPGVAQAWGVRLDNLWPASRPCLVLVAGVGAALVAYRLIRGGLSLPGHAGLVFALYTVWGVFQQFFVQSMVTRNLRSLGLGAGAVIVVTGTLFGLVHLPYLELVALTAPAGALWTYLYLRTPNILPLGLSHAALGTLVYYWVLERDPWLEIFASTYAKGG